MKMHIIEGNSQKLDGGAMFGHVPKSLWRKWYDCDSQNRINLATRALLFEDFEGKNILLEAGIGNFFEPKLMERFGVYDTDHVLLRNLNNLGFSEDDIDYVILSHLHFDHAGGILSSYSEEKPLRLLFPNAKFLTGKEHFTRAQNPHFRDKASFIPLLNKLLIDSKRLILIDSETSPGLEDFCQFYFSSGHTVGLMHSYVKYNEHMIFFASDLIPGQSWVHLPVTMGYDRFPEKLIEEKKFFLEKVLKDNGFLFFTHDSQMSIAKISCDHLGKYSAVSSRPL